jgi:N-methylhydantoinase A
MRYGAQIYEIDVLLDAVDWQSPSLIEQIEERFHDRHEELYTYASRDQETVFVNARVTAIGEVPKSGQGQVPATAGSRCIPRTTRKAFFGEWREIPVYSFDALEHGHVVNGPAIVEAETTTVVINSGDRIAVNDLGWLDIQVR